MTYLFKIEFSKHSLFWLLYLMLNSFYINAQNTTSQQTSNEHKDDSFSYNSSFEYIFSGSTNSSIEKPKDDAQTIYKSMNCPTQNINRTIDGSCNNISTNPTAINGMTGIQLRRVIPDVYNVNNDLVGQNRRNPREISNIIFQMNGEPPSEKLSSFVFTWGQFIDHDITSTPILSTDTVNIPNIPGDIIISPIRFRRSDFLPGTGGNGIPREQINAITSWIDASNVYGSDVTKANSLRTFTDGKMKTSLGNNGEETLPNINGFTAGDDRALEQPGLTSLHVLFLREHNRICCDLVTCGMTDDEVIYQKARKQVGALLQSITYNEFLPTLGIQLPNYQGYNNTVQPDIANVFATAAFRLGHTMVTDNLVLFDDFGNQTATFPLSEVFLNPAFISNNGIEGVLSGLAQQFQEVIDAKIVESLRSHLFASPPPSPGLDLAALNIQRGRDHGLDDYNAFRVAFNVIAANNFSDITSDPILQNQLSTAYNGNVNDIDVWVGLLAEDHLPNSSIGPTLHAMLVSQFLSLRDGDFYFFENDPALTTIEKNIIRNTRLSDVIKRNTNINNIKADVFYGPCSNIVSGGDCPHSLDLWAGTTDILNNGYAHHKASNTIVAGNTIDNSSTAVYQAGYEIMLKPGFEAWHGCDFHGLISSCNDANQVTDCMDDTGDCGCEEWEVCDNGNCLPNSDPEACVCSVVLHVVNNGNCTIELYHWVPTGDIYITSIAPEDSYWVNTFKGEKWRTKIGPFGNLAFNETHMITDCEDQIFVVEPYIENCTLCPEICGIGDSCINDNCVCPVVLEINNHGTCSIHLLHWVPTGDIYITTIAPGSSYWVNTFEGEKWRVIDGSFSQVYMITECQDQVFDIYHCCNNCNECPALCGDCEICVNGTCVLVCDDCEECVDDLCTPPSCDSNSNQQLVLWDLNACQSFQHSGDFSEFIPTYKNECSCMTVCATEIKKSEGTHSCTTSPSGDPGRAMCHGATHGCDFINNNPIGLHFYATVIPDQTAQITELSFYEAAPNNYLWTQPGNPTGTTGPNNYPTFYGIRVLKDGLEIFKQTNIPTTSNWTMETFDFSNNPDFQVTSTTTFKFELMAYCPIGNTANVSVWEIDEISLSGGCAEICDYGYSCVNGECTCQVGFDVINNGNCSVDLYHWTPTGDLYTTTLAPGSFYWTNTFEGEKWFVGTPDNSDYQEFHMITGCQDQIFEIFPCCNNCNECPSLCEDNYSCVNGECTCQVGFDVINSGHCSVDLYKSTPTGNVYVTSIEPESFHWTNTFEGEKWFVYPNYEDYVVTGCEDQIFQVNPCESSISVTGCLLLIDYSDDVPNTGNKGTFAENEPIESPDELIIHPNPTHGKFTFTLNLLKAENIKFSIVDLNNNIIYEQAEYLSFGEHQKKIDLPQKLVNGIYFLKVYLEDQTFNKKIILVR